MANVFDNRVMLKDADGSARGAKTNLQYDPATGTWSPASATNTSASNLRYDPTTGLFSEATSPKNPVSSDTGAENPSKNVDSKKDAEKEYIEAEFNVLTGEMTLTPTEKSIRIKVNDTVRIEGLGKYLSGLYFVSSVSRNINKDNGYTHSLSLIKNGFGSSVKEAQPVKEETRKEEVPKESPKIKLGDPVKIVGDDAVYSNAHDGVKVPAWVKKKTLTVSQVSADGTRVLLMPINSWTYIKNIQK